MARDKKPTLATIVHNLCGDILIADEWFGSKIKLSEPATVTVSDSHFVRHFDYLGRKCIYLIGTRGSTPHNFHIYVKMLDEEKKGTPAYNFGFSIGKKGRIYKVGHPFDPCVEFEGLLATVQRKLRENDEPWAQNALKALEV